MRAILAGEAHPLQTGALLAALRMRGETAEELAGFARAAQETVAAAPAPPGLLDWPSCADNHKQLPYFVLAALLLARAGVPILMHGPEGEGPATTRAVLAALGVIPATNLAAAIASIAGGGLAYMPLAALSPGLDGLIALKSVLGIRTVAHSVARALNPGRARFQMIGVFHRAYQSRQAEAARLLGLLGLRAAAVLRGGAGEAQRQPEKEAAVISLRDGDLIEDVWPPMVADRFAWRDEPLDPARVVDLWQGRRRDPGPEAAVIGTAAIALRLLGRAPDPPTALALASALWRAR